MSAPLDVAELEARTRALLASDRVTEPTRRVLRARLDQQTQPPRAFSADQMRTLHAVCLRLLPEPDLVGRIGLAGRLDARLADGVARGWRHAQAPDDLTLHRLGLDEMERQAWAGAGGRFADLDDQAQDRLLSHAREGRSLDAAVPLDIWFEELLNALVELFYAHPLVQVAIGYDGMADAAGFQAVSLADVAAEARSDG